MDSSDNEQPEGLHMLSKRVSGLEAALQELAAQVTAIEHDVEQHRKAHPVNVPLDHTTARLMRLEAFIIKRFPQYARNVEASVDIPGVTGHGEMGPGNQPMPDVNVGGTMERDPHNRTLR